MESPSGKIISDGCCSNGIMNFTPLLEFLEEELSNMGAELDQLSQQESQVQTETTLRHVKISLIDILSQVREKLATLHYFEVDYPAGTYRNKPQFCDEYSSKELETCQHELNVLRLKKKSLERLVTSREQEIGKYQEKLDTAKSTVNNLRHQLIGTLAEASHEREKFKRTEECLQEQIRQQKKDKDKLQITLLTQQDSEVQWLNQKVQKLEKDRNLKVQQICQLQGMLSDNKKELKHAKEMANKMERELKSRISELGQKSKALDTLHQKFGSLMETNKKLNEQLNEEKEKATYIQHKYGYLQLQVQERKEKEAEREFYQNKLNSCTRMSSENKSPNKKRTQTRNGGNTDLQECPISELKEAKLCEEKCFSLQKYSEKREDIKNSRFIAKTCQGQLRQMTPEKSDLNLELQTSLIYQAEKNDSLKKENEDFKSNNELLQHAQEKLKNEISSLKSDVKNYNEDKRNLELQLMKLEEEKMQLAHNLNAVLNRQNFKQVRTIDEESLTDQEKEEVKMKKLISEQQKLVSKLKNDNKELMEKIELGSKETAELTLKIERHKKDNHMLEMTISRLEKEKQKSNQHLEEICNEKSHLEWELQCEKEKVSDLDKNGRLLQERIDKQHQQVSQPKEENFKLVMTEKYAAIGVDRSPKLDEDNLRLKSEVSKLEEEKRKLETQLQEVNLQKHRNDEELKRKKMNVTTLENEQDLMAKMIIDHKSKITELENEIKRLLSMLTDQVKDSNEHVASLQLKVERYCNENDGLKVQGSKQKEEKQKLLEQLEKECNDKASLQIALRCEKDAVKESEYKLLKLQNLISKQKNQIVDLTDECEKLKQQFKEINEQRNTKKPEVGKYSPDDQRTLLEEKNRQLQIALKELEETKSRLSRVMGDRLTDNNPNITDLSDKNRPTKISERYQELYDNQWTDAFEVVDEELENEEQSITTLKDVLMETMSYCKDEAVKQMERIQTDLTKGQTQPALIMKQFKDIRKAVAETYGKELFKDYMIYLKKDKSKTSAMARKLPDYVQECFDVCWLMEVQDPPVAFGPDIGRNEPFNKDHFKAYTKGGGAVKYIVWPVLLLHENGPVLCKGVAQGDN